MEVESIFFTLPPVDIRSLSRRVIRGLRRVRFAALVVVLLGAALSLAILSTGGDPPDGDREGSVVVSEHAGALGRVATPSSLHVVYREERAHTTTRTEVWVRRPFSGRVETGSEVRVSTFGRLGVIPRRGTSLALNIPPEAAVGDLRWTGGTAERHERRRITGLDRQCDVYRARGTTTRTHQDVCVDAAGLVIEAVTVVDGTAVARRVATELEIDPDLPVSLFDGPDVAPAPPAEGGGSILAVDPASRPPGTFYELAEPPGGFRLRGRYAVIPPRDAATTDWLVDRRTSVVDVWVNGPDFLAVDRGQTLGKVDPFEPKGDARRVDAGALGTAELFTDLAIGSQLRVDLGEGRYVRLYGTVDADVLVGLARRLEPVEGGELVYLDPPER